MKFQVNVINVPCHPETGREQETNRRPLRGQLTNFTATRRVAIQSVGLSLVLPALAGDALAAEDVLPLNRFPRMVQEYFVQLVRDIYRTHELDKPAFDSRKVTEHFIEQLRTKIRTCFGPEPERTPLNPTITGVVERDAYVIEKLIFESRPGFFVTANVYVPKGRKAPMPAVVGTCGHARSAKTYEQYQAFAQGLARQGYVCLIYDPIGQGERIQYVDDNLKPRLKGPVHEHLYAGNQQFLVGDFFGSWCAWDGIRALDYLHTREDVDHEKLGITGNSGGGTLTTWLCALDSRWSMAAPSCFVTSFLRNLENELPADTEQCPPGAIALGLEHHDFLAAMAPKPIIILAKERDFFDVRGSQEAYEALKPIYEATGNTNQIALHIGPTDHGFSIESREAMYGWFNQVTGTAEGSTEPEVIIEKDETLWCTPKGQLEGSNVKTVFHFTQELSKQLSNRRGNVANPELISKVKNVLKLPPIPSAAPEFRILRGSRAVGYPTSDRVTYAIESEPGILAIVYMLSETSWISRPPQDGKRAVLYVSHRSSDDELRSEPLIRQIIDEEPESRFFTCDVRGIGESKPNTCNPQSFDDPYGCDYFYAIHSLMLDRPYLGQKTFDVLRVIDFLSAQGHQDIHLVGKGWGALAATFAALLSDRVSQVTLKHALTSYTDIAQSEAYTWPLATFLPNVLSHFDMPDCYRALKTKRLRQLEPWGPSQT